MFTVDINIRVRYAETDQMGYVYYGNYATYFEVARVEMFRQLGLTYKKIEEMGLIMPVLDMKIKYIRPAKYDDLLTIKTSIKEKPTGARIQYEYEVYNEEAVLLTKAETTLVFVDSKTQKPTYSPKQFIELLEPHFLNESTHVDSKKSY